MITNINNTVYNFRKITFCGQKEKAAGTRTSCNAPYRSPLGVYADTFVRQNAQRENAQQTDKTPKNTGKKQAATAHPFRKISYNKAKNMLSYEKIAAVQEFLRQNKDFMNASNPADKNPVIKDMFEIEGKKYDARFSGGGGTKNTFQIEQGGKKYTLALPTYVDNPQIAAEKWLDVLEFEPKNTKLLRDKGLKTNDIFDIVPVKVNGAEFPAVLMKPYSEHSFKVGDRKNYSFANLLNFEEVDILNDRMFLDLFKDIPKEIAKLTALGIEPHYDCVNLCREKKTGSKDCTGAFHLYLNDLDKNFAKKKLTEKEAEQCIKNYTYLAISALPETVDRNLRQWCDYFVFIEANEGIRKKIETQAMEEYQKIKGR